MHTHMHTHTHTVAVVMCRERDSLQNRNGTKIYFPPRGLGVFHAVVWGRSLSPNLGLVSLNKKVELTGS